MTYENLDVKLVNSLLDDGRASLQDLSEEEEDVSITTVSNYLSDLEDTGVIQSYTPKVDYNAVGYDVTAIIQLKVEGNALPEITDQLQEHAQMISVYEVTGDHDIIAIGKFSDTNGMNQQIKTFLNSQDINESNTSVVLNTACENEQFKIDGEE